MATFPPVSIEWLSWLVPIVWAGLGFALLLWRRRALAGTTLVAPWYWAIVCLAAVAGVEVVAGLTTPDCQPYWLVSLRLMAAVSTFCPIVSALGAKRPQHRVWQWIVLSLWCILSLPAAEAVWLQPGTELHIQGARSWFLVCLVILCTLNGLPTRFGLSAMLFGAAQVMLLAGQLPLVSLKAGIGWPQIGLGLMVMSLLLVALGIPPRRKIKQPVDRVWLDFRDMFGALWALRFAERINHSAVMYQWNLTLLWRGFQANTGSDGEQEIAPEVADQLTASMQSILRRFVSKEWIAVRLQNRID